MKAFLLFALTIILVGCASSENQVTNMTSPMPLPTVNPSNQAMVTAQKNYDIYCAHCHGYSGEGQATGGGPGSIEWTENLGYHTVPLHNADGHTWQHPDQILFETIKYGIDSPLNLYPDGRIW